MITTVDNRILFEDNHIIAVNKLPSEIVQGDRTGDITLGETVKAYIKSKFNKPGEVFLGVTHRIDRPVSGIVLFARTSKSLARLNDMFKARQIQKTYWAVVKEAPQQAEGTLIHYLKKNEANNKSFASLTPQKGALLSELTYKIIDKSENYYLLEIHPHTGRHHQIRVQLSTMGSPIKGDLKYGFNRSNPDASIHLHARQIDFLHPVRNEPVRIIAPTPNEALWNYFMSRSS